MKIKFMLAFIMNNGQDEKNLKFDGEDVNQTRNS